MRKSGRGNGGGKRMRARKGGEAPTNDSGDGGGGYSTTLLLLMRLAVKEGLLGFHSHPHKTVLILPMELLH